MMLLLVAGFFFFFFFPSNFVLMFVFLLYVFLAAVVRSINKSGTESKDSTVQTSLQDPLSCRQRPFTGKFLYDLNYLLLFFFPLIF